MTVKFTVTLNTFARVQFAVVTIVIALGAVAYVFSNLMGYSELPRILRLLDVGVEQSIPTFVSIINLLLASVLSFMIFAVEKTNKSKGSGYWLFLSALMLFLSFDEFASIHEKFGRVYRYLANQELIPPIMDSHQWLPFGLFFLLVVSIILLPFLKQLPTDTLRYFIIAGGVFVTGAVGFEYLGSVMLKTGMVDSKMDLAYLVRRLFEESFEMYGIAFFNWALYREVLRRKISVTIEH